MNNMIHYCLDVRSATNHFPGIGRYVSNLARALVPQLNPDEALILLVDRSRPSPWSLPAALNQVKVVETAVSPFSLSQQWVIPKLLKQHQVQVYHSPYYLMPYFSGLPTAVTIHDLIPQLFPEYFPAKTRLLSNWLKRLALRRAVVILTVSQATRQDLLKKYEIPPAKVKAVPHAADGRFRPQSQIEINRVLHKYTLPDAYLFYLGINKPHKNLPLLVQSYAALAATQQQIPPLIIAGAWDGRYPEVKQMAEQSEAGHLIRFLGPVPDEDLPGLYSGARFFVFPSLYEGFGLPVIEAMACGTAVICAASSSLLEVTAEAALTFEPQRADQLIAQIQRFLQNPELIKEYEERGLKQADNFSWQKTAVATINCYRSLL